MSIDCGAARELAQDYLDGTLRPADGALLDHHLRGCPYCPACYRALQAGVAALGRVGEQLIGQAEAVLAGALAQITAHPGQSD